MNVHGLLLLVLDFGRALANCRGVNEMNVHANLEAENDRSTCIGSRISWCLQETMTMIRLGLCMLLRQYHS